MEKIIEYLFINLELKHNVAPVIAFLIAVAENKSKGFKDRLIVAILAVGIAGVVEGYLPQHTFFVSICVGIASGVCTDDLYTRFVDKFPTFIDDVLNTMFNGIKNLLKKFFGK